MREYYGDWYYLHVFKKWINDYDYWSVYSVINNIDDIEVLTKISGFVREPVTCSKYNGWVRHMSTLAETLSEINHPNKDEILRHIYISGVCYEFGEDFCIFYIVKPKIKFETPGFNIYPIDPDDKYKTGTIPIIMPTTNIELEPGDFYYKIRFDYFGNSSITGFNNCSIVKNHPTSLNYMSREGFHEKISIIAQEFNFEREILMKIVIILLGKTRSLWNRIVNFFAHGEFA